VVPFSLLLSFGEAKESKEESFTRSEKKRSFNNFCVWYRTLVILLMIQYAKER
jgi:hypothetical protein